MTIILRPDGTVNITEGKPSLEEMQQLVGGWVELIPGWERHAGEPCQAYCNEEGKIDDLPFNPGATSLWSQQLGYAADRLVGTVVILTGASRWK